MAPTYDQDKASVFWYSPKDWKRHVVADDIPGIIHRVRPVTWDSGKREQFLVASFEGIALYRATGSGDAMKFEKQLLSPGHVEKAPRLGASDVGVGQQDGKRFFASVEPWHGNEVVVYTEKGGTVGAPRHLRQGDERPRDRGRRSERRRPRRCRGQRQQPRHRSSNPNATPGVHVFFAPEDAATGEWQYRRIEDKAAMNSCVGADVNGDKRPDLVCTGAGGAIRWYENKGASRGTAAAGR